METNDNEINEVHSMPAQNITKMSKFTVGEPEKKKGHVLPIILGVLLAVLISGGLWFYLRNNKNLSPVLIQDTSSGESEEAFVRIEGTVLNPITGERVPEEEAAKWADQRPIGVMVNNHVDARPQSGLIYADVVYEIVAEGGITRFLAFYLSQAPEKIGPVRSVREYYLVLAKELGDAMIMHIGWSPQALEAIENWPVRSLARGGAGFWRDNPRDVAIEHTAYVSGVALRELAFNLGWEGFGEFDVWKFKDNTDRYSSYPSANNLTIDFWYEGDYSAIFNYNAERNSYLRSMGYDAEGNAIPHKDQETDAQIELKNVIVQYVVEVPIEGDDKSRLEYQLVGSGTGVVFIDGKAVPVTWAKESRDTRTIFYDQDGNEMEFNRGKFWVSIVPDRNIEQVIYN